MQTKSSYPWLMLISRSVFFLLLQVWNFFLMMGILKMTFYRLLPILQILKQIMKHNFIF